MADTYTVKAGDSLWAIAQKQLGSGTRWTEIADLNGISRSYPLIHPGDVLRLTVAPASSSSASKPTYSTTVKLNYFGLEANAEGSRARRLIATWDWDRDHTEGYDVRYWYQGVEGVSLVAEDTHIDWWPKEFVWTAPDNAVKVWLHIRPVSTTYKSNDQDVHYWTGEWSEAKYWYFDQNPPEKPNAPSVEIEGLKLTATLDDIDDLGKKATFQVVKDNTTVFATGTVDVTTGHASYTCNLVAGGEYKVRCQLDNNGQTSPWSDYSSNEETVPDAPTEISVLKATSDTAVHIEWPEVVTAESYTVEYTTKIIYFDASSEVQSITVEANHAEITGIESGEEYFFRVRATNDQGDSPWTEIKSLLLGKKPSAPTTWSSSTSVITGEPLILYWVHNSEDGSSEKYAQLELTINGVTETYTIENTADEEHKDDVKTYIIDTTLYVEGTKIEWRVKTAGVTLEFGDWSVKRTIDIYAPPVLQLSVTDSDGDAISTVTEFPFYINALPGPNTQSPVGYFVEIISNSTYETSDDIGNVQIVNAGSQVYSSYFNTNEHLLVEMSAGNVNLENTIEYTVNVTVSMNSGLSAEDTATFNVSWVDQLYSPNAEIAIDPETVVAYVKPYCEAYERVCKLVEYNPSFDSYIKTNTILENTEGWTVNGVVTTTDELVYNTEIDPEDYSEGTYFCLDLPTEGSLIDDVVLSVYRREYDGRFVEIASDLLNDESTFTTDPHPALDFARYRIVAKSLTTGSIGYADIPGVATNEKAIIIQWDERWSNFNTKEGEVLAEPAWSGSMLKLPYNVDVSDSYDVDVSLISYIGRENPVSYYGTQRGISATWNVDIPKDDVDTLYALRRLAIWPGDAYVREPSGTGYWANVKVSFSQKHRNVTIPVTLQIARVEGGV